MNLQSLQHICVGDRVVVHTLTYMLTSAPLYITHDTDRASMPIHCQLDSTRRLQKPLRVSKFEHAPREKGCKPMSLWAAMGLTRRHLPLPIFTWHCCALCMCDWRGGQSSAMPLECSIGVAEIGHAPWSWVGGRKLGSQRLDWLLRYREVSRHDCAQAALLLQRKVCAVKALLAAPLHAQQCIQASVLLHICASMAGKTGEVSL